MVKFMEFYHWYKTVITLEYKQTLTSNKNQVSYLIVIVTCFNLSNNALGKWKQEWSILKQKMDQEWSIFCFKIAVKFTKGQICNGT